MNSLQEHPTPNWQYLVARPHPWRKQLFIKGKKLLASTVWQDMVVNNMTTEQAADNWDLPITVIREILDYCVSNACQRHRHQDLIALEAAEERHRIEAKGVRLEPQPIANYASSLFIKMLNRLIT